MDRTNIIRNRIADLRSEKYAYLNYCLKEEKYEYPYSLAAEEWRDLLGYLESNIQTEGVEYNVAAEEEGVEFATIYTEESLREYINNIAICSESTTRQIHIISCILQIDQSFNNIISVNSFSRNRSWLQIQ